MKNKKFKLFNEQWEIKYVNHIDDDELSENEKYDLMGVTYSARKQIFIALKDRNNEDIPEDSIRITLLHELMHVICGSGAYMNYNNDEPFIEWCAKCLDDMIRKKVI